MNKKKKKRIVPPRAEITDAKEGIVRFWTTDKTTKGIYELVLTGDNGKELMACKVEVI